MRPAFALLVVSSSIALALPSNDLDTIHARRGAAASPGQDSSATTPHALSDRSNLKYQIAGIVGAYVFWLVATALLVIFVGNRLRRKAQTSNTNLNITMMKTFHTTEQVVEVPKGMETTSMKSPGMLKSPKLSSIKSWGKKKGHSSVNSTSSMTSEQSHEQHKAQDMDDLAKLYAAVMAHDEEKTHGRNSAAQSPTSPNTTSPLSPGYPPEFAHLHNANVSAQTPQSPVLNQQLHHPLAPTPTGASFPPERSSHYDPNIPSRSNSRTTKNTPLSFISDASSRAGSVMSSRSKPSRISIRGQNISQPIGSADLRDAIYYEETVPLSPRVYAPGPPPPTPGKKKQVQVTIEPIDEYPTSQYQYEDNYRPHHQQYQDDQHQQQSPNSQRSTSSFSHRSTSPLVQSLREKRIPPNLALHASAAAQYSNNNTTRMGSAATALPSNAPRALPFRDIYGDASLRSAPPTKTTFLDRPTKLPLGPKTGVVPMTPYSPYMPGTPMTPITPRRMMNRQELKMKRKEEMLKVLSEDDLVVGDDDMWGK